MFIVLKEEIPFMSKKFHQGVKESQEVSEELKRSKDYANIFWINYVFIFNVFFADLIGHLFCSLELLELHASPVFPPLI